MDPVRHSIKISTETYQLLEGIYQLRKALGKKTFRGHLIAEGLLELFEKIQRDHEQEAQ